MNMYSRDNSRLTTSGTKTSKSSRASDIEVARAGAERSSSMLSAMPSSAGGRHSSLLGAGIGGAGGGMYMDMDELPVFDDKVR